MPYFLECAVFAVAAGGWLLARRRAPLEALQPAGEAPATQDPAGTYPLVLTAPPHPVVITEKARFQHLEIMGSSGTGKNYHGLLPMIHQDISRGAGVIVVDPKGSMRGAVAAYARACGRSKDLRCLDLGDPGGSDTYNPLVGDDPSLVAERVHAAFYADDATATSYYRDTALGLFYPFFALCHRLGVLPTLGQLRAVALDQGKLANVADLAPTSSEAQDLRRQSLRQAPLEYSRNLQGVVNALTGLTSGAFARLLNTTSPGIVLSEVLSEGGILYAGLASDRYPSLFKRVSTLLLMDLQSSLTQRYGGRAPAVFVYLDEFADLLYPQARALIAKAREARVGIVLAHQSLGDLARRGAATADAIFENTSNKILLRTGGADSAQLLARLSGTRAKGRGRYSRTLNRGGLRGDSTAKGLNERGDREPLFHPNDLMNLAVGEAFMVVQNSGGRELYRGRLNSAPEPGPAVPAKGGSGRARTKRPRAYRPLVLGAAEAPEGPSARPTTPLAKAALERMQRSRRGP